MLDILGLSLYVCLTLEQDGSIQNSFMKPVWHPVAQLDECCHQVKRFKPQPGLQDMNVDGSGMSGTTRVEEGEGWLEGVTLETGGYIQGADPPPWFKGSEQRDYGAWREGVDLVLHYIGIHAFSTLTAKAFLHPTSTSLSAQCEDKPNSNRQPLSSVARL